MFNMGELSYSYVRSIALWSLVVWSAFFVVRLITQRAFDSTSGAGAKNDKARVCSSRGRSRSASSLSGAAVS